MGTAAINNYLTRMLLGPSAFFLPLRAINESHFHAAAAVLAAFSAVVPIDRLDDPTSLAWLRTALGWQGAPERRNSHHKQYAHQAQTIGERTMRLLQELNRYDSQLVHEVRERFDRRVAAGRSILSIDPIARSSRSQRTCIRQCPPGRVYWSLGASRSRLRS